MPIWGTVNPWEGPRKHKGTRWSLTSNIADDKREKGVRYVNYCRRFPGIQRSAQELQLGSESPPKGLGDGGCTSRQLRTRKAGTRLPPSVVRNCGNVDWVNKASVGTPRWELRTGPCDLSRPSPGHSHTAT